MIKFTHILEGGGESHDYATELFIGKLFLHNDTITQLYFLFVNLQTRSQGTYVCHYVQ